MITKIVSAFKVRALGSQITRTIQRSANGRGDAQEMVDVLPSRNLYFRWGGWGGGGGAVKLDYLFFGKHANECYHLKVVMLE